MKHIKPIYGEHYAPGYIGFSRPAKGKGSLLSKAIIWFQSLEEASDFIPSHVFMVVSKEGKKSGIESAEKGVEFFDLQERLADKSLEFVFRKPKDLDDITWKQMYHQAIIDEQGEKPYDYTGLVGWVLRSTLKLDSVIKPLRKLPVPLNFFGGVYCSAACARWLKAADKYMKWVLFKDWHVTRIGPVKLLVEGPWSELKLTKEET